jgi:hypothetical protein
MKKNIAYKHCAARLRAQVPMWWYNGLRYFGMFGTTVHCNAERWLCNFMKVFNVLMVMGIIVSVLFFITDKTLI